MHSVLRTVQCCGDYDRLMQGVYENFLHMNFRDSRLEAVRCKLSTPKWCAEFRHLLTASVLSVTFCVILR